MYEVPSSCATAVWIEALPTGRVGRCRVVMCGSRHFIASTPTHSEGAPLVQKHTPHTIMGKLLYLFLLLSKWDEIFAISPRPIYGTKQIGKCKCMFRLEGAEQ